MSIAEKIFGDLNKKEVKKVQKIADKVLALDEKMQELSDNELQEKTNEFKDRIKSGESLDSLLPEAFAVCREAAWRTLEMKHFPVQILGGIVLHQGRVAEMRTGEGKSLTATLPVYLNALDGRGVYVVTVNDYLARRDMEQMSKLYNFLGLSVGCVTNRSTTEERRKAYASDITYGTNNEFGFDYLRDNMQAKLDGVIQRELNYAIVDEVDSILIDEARTPLIISGETKGSTEMYQKADAFVQMLKKDDYEIKERDNQISLTDSGVQKCEKYFNIENFSDPNNMEINHHVMQALRARYMMKNEVDYIVSDGEVLIVDEFTGRIMPGRRFSNGLHQAIEMKEGINVGGESKTLATITLQNYFRMFNKLAGMTGTGKTEEEELTEIYNMNVVCIPTNKPVLRIDLPDAVYTTTEGKFNAVADYIEKVHETGQPILVGTVSVEKSEYLAMLLRKRGLRNFNVLNAKNHEKEAKIVAEAGRKGAVTIATNMAGRGTDIILGGNPDFEALQEMKALGYEEDVISFATGFTKTDDEDLLKAREKYHELRDKYRKLRAPEQEEVRKLGGLCIIGTERHESRRIDNQLRGRSGRQGDPGVSQFCVSLEDDLMRMFGGDALKKFLDKGGLAPDEAIESKMVSRQIESAQKKVEGKNFGTRKYVLKYDDVMNKQRKIIYSERRRVLEGISLRTDVTEMTRQLIDEIVDHNTNVSNNAKEWDFDKINAKLCEISKSFEPLNFDEDTLSQITPQSLKEGLYEDFEDIYRNIEKDIPEDIIRDIERMILLNSIDEHWMNHIDDMDHLKDGIGLRSLGGQDPAAVYAEEGFDMFELLVASIKETFIKNCFEITNKTSRKDPNTIIIEIGNNKDKTENKGKRESKPLIPIMVPSKKKKDI